MDEGEYTVQFAVEETHWWFVARRRFIEEVLWASGIRAGQNRRIADIGAGTGGMDKLLSQYGHVVGIEPHRLARRLARRRGVVLRRGTAEKTGLEKESVDLACFFDVLYHKGIHDRKALTEAYRILKPGGWLCITDCALPFLSGPHDEAMQARERYKLSGLAAKVRRAGFRIEKQTYTFFLLFPLIAVKRLFNKYFSQSAKQSDVTVIPPRLNILLTLVCSMEAALLSRISYPWGSSLLILAVKKKGV